MKLNFIYKTLAHVKKTQIYDGVDIIKNIWVIFWYVIKFDKIKLDL